MAIVTTTAKTIVDELIDLIEDVTPSHAESTDIEWTHTEDFLVAGSAPRTFDLVAHPEVPDPEGLHGADGIGYRMIVELVTSYGGMAPADARRIIGDDGADLRKVFETLHTKIDGTLPVPDEVIIDDKVLEDEEGNGTLVAVYRVLVRFKRADN